jgi:hypothetical protein
MSYVITNQSFTHLQVTTAALYSPDCGSGAIPFIPACQVRVHVMGVSRALPNVQQIFFLKASRSVKAKKKQCEARFYSITSLGSLPSETKLPASTTISLLSNGDT